MIPCRHGASSAPSLAFNGQIEFRKQFLPAGLNVDTNYHRNELQTNDHINRRNLLQAASLLSFVPFTPAAHAAPSRVELPAGGEIPAGPRAYFTGVVEAIASQIGPEFTARLAIYGITPNLPSGVPGDPAKDYQSSRSGGDGRCGAFQPSLPEGRSYALCPLPGQVPSDETARECCRHYAFAVPYSKFGFAVEDRYTTIIVSPRLFLLPPERWQAILAHELGHAVDFYLFGSKYRLLNHETSRSTFTDLRAQLQLIDEFEEDPELRADALGELLVLKPRKEKLCYDPVLTLQTLADPSEKCDGDGSGAALMRHYTHPPLQGSSDSLRI